MTQEKPWWIDNEYWWPYDPELGHQAKHVDMIAEATRRGIQQGKREAWEEAIQIVRLKDWGEHTRHDACNEIIKALDAKLVSLLDSSKE